jgi:RNA-directed DNA polymerase
LSNLLARINYLVRWIRKKFKRLRPHRKAREYWERTTTEYPRAFAYWRWVAHPLMIKTAGAR